MEASRTAGGTGPGVIAPDGSPVELYSLPAAGDEPEIVAEAMGGHGSIFELGSGPGRLTHALAGLGYEVVAAGEPAAMLEWVRSAGRACARIETLDPGRRLDCVLHGSFLVNTPDAAQRAALLAACRRHVRDDGCMLIEWQPAQAQDSLEAGEGGTLRGIRVTVLALEHPAPGFAAVTMQYQAASQTWTQSLVSQRLTDEDLRACLARAGLRPDRYITEGQTWLRAVPDTEPPGQRLSGGMI